MIGCKFDISSAMQYLISSERHRYEIGCETLTGEEVFGYGHRAHCIIGLDRDGRAIVFSSCTEWDLGRICLEQQNRNFMFLSDYVFARLPPNIDKFTWLFNL